MRKFAGCLLLLVVVGLATAPVFAAELRVTGFFDNVLPHWEKNISGQNGDNDTTRAHDMATFGRERFRGFFNFIATDDLRGVFAIEIDQIYGAPAMNAVGSACVTGTGTYAFEQCGFAMESTTMPSRSSNCTSISAYPSYRSGIERNWVAIAVQPYPAP